MKSKQIYREVNKNFNTNLCELKIIYFFRHFSSCQSVYKTIIFAQECDCCIFHIQNKWSRERRSPFGCLILLVFRRENLKVHGS